MCSEQAPGHAWRLAWRIFNEFCTCFQRGNASPDFQVLPVITSHDEGEGRYADMEEDVQVLGTYLGRLDGVVGLSHLRFK